MTGIDSSVIFWGIHLIVRHFLLSVLMYVVHVPEKFERGLRKYTKFSLSGEIGSMLALIVLWILLFFFLSHDMRISNHDVTNYAAYELVFSFTSIQTDILKLFRVALFYCIVIQ